LFVRFTSYTRKTGDDGRAEIFGLLTPVQMGRNAKGVKTSTSGVCTLMAATLLLAGCSTDYQPLESRAPVVREGAYGTRKVVDGVDIWTTGEPPRKYQVLGVINDERVQAPFEMARYYHDVAAKVKQVGGNGAID
jgi:hypothetical protein